MAKPNKPERRKIKKIPLTDEQLSEAKLLVAEELEANPEIFNLPESKRSVEDISNFFVKVNADQVMRKMLPKERCRYVMYLRRSTDNEDKQVRSIEDQEVECRALAEQKGLKVRDEDIISENASAKKSGNRPQFEEMLRGFKSGKYQGLIAWSPDRLSRNMKEAGEIIEMIDENEIQDLHFKTQTFENTPTGKMMLGILFATSKQYSDNLSVNVSRGIEGNARDGKYNGIIKKGYYVDPLSGHFMPDAHKAIIA